LRRALAVAAVGACLLLAVPAALADGDPASDYLLTYQAFVPPDDGIPPAYANQLTELLTAERKAGYTIRVALIGTRYDMGSVVVLYRLPKQYARFLGQELFFVYKGRLLVVMPNGYGVSRGGKALPVQQALTDRLPAPGASGAQLATAAMRAVRALAAASGVQVALPPLRGSKGTSANQERLEIGVGAAILLVLGGGLTLLRRRLRGRRAG
jgi:hypothetical protein